MLHRKEIMVKPLNHDMVLLRDTDIQTGGFYFLGILETDAVKSHRHKEAMGGKRLWKSFWDDLPVTLHKALPSIFPICPMKWVWQHKNWASQNKPL